MDFPKGHFLGIEDIVFNLCTREFGNRRLAYIMIDLGSLGETIEYGGRPFCKMSWKEIHALDKKLGLNSKKESIFDPDARGGFFQIPFDDIDHARKCFAELMEIGFKKDDHIYLHYDD